MCSSSRDSPFHLKDGEAGLARAEVVGERDDVRDIRGRTGAGNAGADGGDESGVLAEASLVVEGAAGGDNSVEEAAIGADGEISTGDDPGGDRGGECGNGEDGELHDCEVVGVEVIGLKLL